MVITVILKDNILKMIASHIVRGTNTMIKNIINLMVKVIKAIMGSAQNDTIVKVLAITMIINVVIITTDMTITETSIIQPTL